MFSLLESSLLSTTLPISALFLLAPMVSARSSSSPPTQVLLPLLVVLPPVTSPTISPVRSRNPALSSLPIPAPMHRPSRKHHTSISPSSVCATPTPLPSSLILPFLPTTRVATLSASSGGCLPVKSSVSVEPLPQGTPSGT